VPDWLFFCQGVEFMQREENKTIYFVLKAKSWIKEKKYAKFVSKIIIFTEKVNYCLRFL
jgi:hypothetical protein